ncbi:MAG: hydantoinase/oxoprolinase family protein, partial [Stellaceae bacterium]
LSAPAPAQAADPPPAPKLHTPQPGRSRPVFDPETGEFIEVAILERGHLLPGAVIPGPAVIVEDETSTVVSRSFDARIDAFGYIELVRRGAAQR